MIGGLIEHEDLGLAEDNFSDGDTHAPATGEAVGGAVQVRLGEADTREDLDSFRFARLRIDVFQAGGDLGETFAHSGFFVGVKF